MSEPLSGLTGIEAFRSLPSDDLRQLEGKLQIVSVQRGQYLFRQGEPADALYIVSTGRFEVTRDDRPEAVASIGSGLPIGEIAFFSGGTRTANVVAERDSLVLRLDRSEFESLARTSPSIWNTVTATLARRLAETTSHRWKPPVPPLPRTFCILPADGFPIPSDFVRRLRAAFKGRVNAQFLDSVDIVKRQNDKVDHTRWFNELEGQSEAIFFIADTTVTEWSKKAVRQADLVLCVGQHDDAADQVRQATPLEQYAAAMHKPGHLRLVLLHRATSVYRYARSWLDNRPWCHMHHHVVMEQDADYSRLFRFLTGRALGLVACGGGAFSAAHIGVYQAIREQGLVLDMTCGTSGGAAMAAAFSLGVDPDEIERRVRDIFVVRKALGRWTLPRYSLLDPAPFDDAFREHFTDVDIADLPIPYFAISTNLSRNEIHCHRIGPLWHAVRSSCTIPALLPPAYSALGDMLVDGGLLENVPIKSMHKLKSGPNIVIDFQVPILESFEGAREQLPSRWQLLINSLTSHRRSQLPKAPSPQAVLLRSLMIHGHNTRIDIGPEDVLLEPMMPSHITHLDWNKHGELRQFGYEFARRALSRRPPST